MGDLLNTGRFLLAAEEAEHGGHHGPNFIGLLVYIALVLAIVFVLMSYAKKGFKDRVFRNPISQLAEQLYLFIQQMCVGTIGAHGRKYIPMIFTFWLIIFTANVVALFFPAAPTADLGFNLGMALIAIGYVQFEGIRQNGVVGHFSHFAGPKLGYALIPISIMIFLIEIVSEAMKNLSLSLRLFGNIHGGHEAVTAMNTVGDHAFGLDWLNIPVGAFLLPIKLLTCVVQALVFCMLTCVYISLVTHHEDHDETHGHEALAH